MGNSSNIATNRLKDSIFKYVGLFCTVFGIIILTMFLGKILIDGVARINWDFMTRLPSRKASNAGILTAWVGTVWILGLTALISIPLGVSAGIFLEEYGKKSRLAAVVETNITNLAGVPSIIYGLLGLEMFVRVMSFGGSLLSGALTLPLLILPILIVATRETLKSVPNSMREASFALGASKWQTIWHQILPAASGGIMTGIILALSRAIGETAPLIVIGALAYVPFVPSSPMDEFTVLPMIIFNWVSRPQEEFLTNAAAGIIILLVITFIMNGTAVYLRNKWQKKINW